MALTNSLAFFILITNVLCNEDRSLLVGPRPNQETGRYIYKTQTSSYKHCLYCDAKIAFHNTSMNDKHQEPNCIHKYNTTKIIEGFTEYERTHHLTPICKLGVVPGCGPPPDEKFIQYCDPGYSNVNYSVYFSCMIANDETRTLLSMYYCNENMQWEFIREYKSDVVTDTTSIPVVVKKETVVIVTLGTNITTPAETPLMPNDEQSQTDTRSGTTGHFTTLYTVVVILACVMALLALGLGVMLGRYLCKRYRIRVSGFFTGNSTKPSSLSPQFGRLPSNECKGEEGSSLIAGGESCQADVEGGNGLMTGESQRGQPVGQEHILLNVTLNNEISTTVTQNVPDKEKSNCRPYHSCPTRQRSDIGENEPGYNQAPNIQNQDGGRNQRTSRPNDTQFGENRVISRTGDQRKEPIGKASTPRHRDRLEENCENTEPKRVISFERINRLGIENDVSFEIGPADSGINMNADAESLQIQNLKEK